MTVPQEHQTKAHSIKIKQHMKFIITSKLNDINSNATVNDDDMLSLSSSLSFDKMKYKRPKLYQSMKKKLKNKNRYRYV